MSGIGGANLGFSGLGAPGASNTLGGTGVEGSPDGAGGAVGLTDTTILFSTVPANWIESPSGMFNWSAASDYSFHDGSYAYGGDGIELFWCPDSALWPAGSSIDVQWTFKWLVAADTVTEQMYWGIGSEPVGTTNDAQPAFIGPGTDRNFNRYYPGRAKAASTVGNPVSLTNGTALHNLAGGELTADDATDHTVGFQVVNNEGTYTFRTFFDGTEQIASFVLTVAEAAIFDACNRPAWRGPLASVASLCFRIKSVRYAPAGTIYT